MHFKREKKLVITIITKKIKLLFVFLQMQCSGTERQRAVMSVIINFPAHLFAAGASLLNLARFHSLFIVMQRCVPDEHAVDFSLGIASCQIQQLHRESHRKTMHIRGERKKRFKVRQSSRRFSRRCAL